MRYFALILLALSITAAGMTGCGKKSGTPAATPAAAVPIVGAGTCLAGQVYHSTYGCLDRAHCYEGQGWVPTLNHCEAGTPITWDQTFGGTATHRWGYALQGISRRIFEQLMREYGGFCDLYTWNWGAADCDSYSSKGYIIIQTSGPSATQAQITIGAGASAPYYQHDFWSAYMGADASFPMQFRATVSPSNNSLGLDFRAQLPSRSWSQTGGHLQVYVETGRLTDNVLNAEISYMNQPFATAPAERY